MNEQVGRTFPLSIPRRLICDLLHFARQAPTVPVQRRMHLDGLVRARAQTTGRVGWCAIFTKAYARVAVQFPELRRAYLSFPTPRLYQHPFSIASVAVERLYDGENAVLFAHLREPEGQTLRQLDEHLRRFKEEPIENFGLFRRALKVSRLPRWLRRAMWWYGLNTSGPRRARHMGTFGVSVYSGLGAESLHPLSPLTTTLHYGVLRLDQSMSVRITYDHRVMDGATVARALALMEDVLNQDMAAELYEAEAALVRELHKTDPALAA
jgi:hypothetical protein